MQERINTAKSQILYKILQHKSVCCNVPGKHYHHHSELCALCKLILTPLYLLWIQFKHRLHCITLQSTPLSQTAMAMQEDTVNEYFNND